MLWDNDDSMAQLLITGGAGFIGSHTCLVLLETGHQLLVLDDFSNSSAVALERVAELAGVRLQRDQRTLKAAPETFTLVEGDIRDAQCLDALFASATTFGQPIEAVIGVLSNYLSRKHEFEADAFAVRTTALPDAMIGGLKRLSVDNLSNLEPSYLKVWVDYTHPPVLQRINAIRKLA